MSPGSGSNNVNYSVHHSEAHASSKLLVTEAQAFKTVGTEEPIAIHITQEITDKGYPFLVPTTVDQLIREKLVDEPSQIAFSISLYGLSDLDDLRASLWSVALQEGISTDSVNIITDNSHSQHDLIELAWSVYSPRLAGRELSDNGRNWFSAPKYRSLGGWPR